MTEQQIIPNKRYRHTDHPETIYEGRGDVDPDTLDCSNKRMVRIVNIGGRNFDRFVMPPNLPTSLPFFWNKFFPVRV